MTEQSALTLSNTKNKEEFVKTWTAGEQTFPIMASVKITRTLQKPDGVGQPDGTADSPTNLTIVHASDQPFEEAPHAGHGGPDPLSEGHYGRYILYLARSSAHDQGVCLLQFRSCMPQRLRGP